MLVAIGGIVLMFPKELRVLSETSGDAAEDLHFLRKTFFGLFSPPYLLSASFFTRSQKLTTHRLPRKKSSPPVTR